MKAGGPTTTPMGGIAGMAEEEERRAGGAGRMEWEGKMIVATIARWTSTRLEILLQDLVNSLAPHCVHKSVTIIDLWQDNTQFAIVLDLQLPK